MDQIESKKSNEKILFTNVILLWSVRNLMFCIYFVVFYVICTAQYFIVLSFTSVYFTSLHFSSLHFTSLHFTSLHFTSLHFTSLHFTSWVGRHTDSGWVGGSWRKTKGDRGRGRVAFKLPFISLYCFPTLLCLYFRRATKFPKTFSCTSPEASTLANIFDQLQ